MIEVRIQGETLIVRATITDPDTGAPATPDSHKITLYDSGGTKVDESTAPSEIKTGLFQYTYQIKTDALQGKWTGFWQATLATKFEIEQFTFDLIKGTA